MLKDALLRATVSTGKQGEFAGEVREFDLDKTRFHLRNVRNVGTIRCVMRLDQGTDFAKAMLGEQVVVRGEYESDNEGRPRLLIVENIRILHRPRQDAADFSAE